MLYPSVAGLARLKLLSESAEPLRRRVGVGFVAGAAEVELADMDLMCFFTSTGLGLISGCGTDIGRYFFCNEPLAWYEGAVGSEVPRIDALKEPLSLMDFRMSTGS